MYDNEIVWWCSIETIACHKQSSTIQKVVILRSISAFFSCITTYKKLDEKKFSLKILC
jgi:hypothetical protein